MRVDRRLLAYAFLVWTGVAVLYVVVFGFRRLSWGLPYYASPWQVYNSFVLFYAGAVLSLPLLGIFERIAGETRSFATTLLLYAGTGVAYWVTWSLARVGLEMAGVMRFSTPPPALPDQVVRALVFMAYIALTLYVAMAVLYEAFRHLTQARRAEVEAAQLQAELEVAQAAALRARLNPGFVFDTFQLASELMATNVRAARKVLSDLSELLRVSLGQEGHRLVPLRDELQLMERYLAIQRARPGWRGRVVMDLSPEAEACRVPPLLLQPLLESAVQQGVGRGEGGEVEVRGARRSGALQLTLTARAPAWPVGEVLVERHAESIELTRTRLELAYGEHGGLSVSSPAPDAFEVVMRIPEISDGVMPDA
jgi:hypothetical protein